MIEPLLISGQGFLLGFVFKKYTKYAIVGIVMAITAIVALAYAGFGSIIEGYALSIFQQITPFDAIYNILGVGSGYFVADKFHWKDNTKITPLGA